MDHAAESRITECPQYVRVDFGSCDCLELSETYRSFADLCIGKQVNRALLKAGDNAPEGHRQLRELLSAMARTVAIPPDFKLALVASTSPIEAVYREAQQALRAIGLNAWVFDTVPEAVEWLEGRTAPGQMAS
jgi:hypothetical protein